MDHKGSECLQALFPVSRETIEKLEIYERLLRKWQPFKNLVGPRTLDEFWWRHVADSLQLVNYAPDAAVWADLGSGAGFPGMVVAIAGDLKRSHVHLIESNQRKGAFLREVARETGAPAIVHDERIEDVVDKIAGNVSVVTARALASLSSLCDFAYPIVKGGGMALFLKGQDVDAELTEATRFWNMDMERLPSLTDPQASILKIKQLNRSGTEPN